MRGLLLTLVVCLLAPGRLAAAQTSGAIVGRVIDQTGVALPGVLVSISTDRLNRTTTTSDTGEYRFDELGPGRYRVRFSLLGFAEHARPAVEVVRGEPVRIEVTLHVAMQAEVMVTGRNTFRNLAEIEHPELNLVGLADSASDGAVTGRQLELRPIQRSGEVLESVPGMIVTQHSGEGKANQYYLRGFNLDHGTDFSTVLAGVPLNLPTHAHGHGYTDTSFLIPELVTGVQYFKGPYFADAGDFSSAGSANINYASVLDRPMVRASAGGQGWARAFAAASPRVGRGHVLAAVETARNDGPWHEPDDYERFNGVARYSRGDSLDNLAATVLAYTANWNSTGQAPRRAVDSGLLSRFAGVDPTTGGKTARYAAAAEWQRARNIARSRIAGYAVVYELDLFSNFTYFLSDPLNGDQFHQADRRFVSGLRASHERRAYFAPRTIDYRVGLQFRRDDIGRVGLYRTRARQRLSTVREDEVVQSSMGVWADAEVRWSSWLRSVTGVRFDGYRFDVAAGLAQNSGRESATLVSPKAAIVIGPWAGTEFYVNAGTGFHSNDARGATITIDPVEGSPVERVTPLTRTRGSELGVRTTALRGVQSTLAIWRLSLDSELVFVGDAGTIAASRPSERYGVEWSTFVRLRPWLSVDADVAWSSARFTDGDPAGQRIPGAVERVASLGVSARGAQRAFGSIRWRYFGPRPLTEDDRIRSRATSLVFAQAGYRLTDRLSVVIDGFNLFNARHSDVDYFYTSRLPGEPAGGVDDVHTHPTLPRTARLTLIFGF